MRVLLLAPQVPWPARQGTAIRNSQIALQLARRHDVTILAFGDPGAPRGPLEAAGVRVVAVPPPPPRALSRRVVDLFTTPTPDLARRLDDPGMSEAARRLVGGAAGTFDVLQIEGLEMARHGLAAVAGRRGGRPRTIYDAHNAEWVLQHRAWQTDRGRPRLWHGALYSLVQTAKLRRFERQLLSAVHATVAVSARDADALRAVAPHATVAVVPNGVDTAAFTPSDAALVEPRLTVFTGKMDFRPNVDAMTWFCREVWPAVRAGCPDARLAIVGRDPARRVRALAAPDIAVTGAVDDVRPWLARAGVVVVPLRVGGGTRLKVLEAMAAGKAIAATTLAVEGLNVHSGAEAVLADSASALAAAVVRLMTDAALRAEIGQAGRARAVSEYDWSTLVPGIEVLYGRGGSP